VLRRDDLVCVDVVAKDEHFSADDLVHTWAPM